MHPNTQNFSQVMDIDTSDKLVVSVKLKNHRNPHYKFYINGVNFTLADEFIVHFDLLESLHFKIDCFSKNNEAIEIESITVNGYEIMPRYLHLANPPTHWIENIFSWEFVIPSPFYTWYQEISGGGWVA